MKLTYQDAAKLLLKYDYLIGTKIIAEDTNDFTIDDIIIAPYDEADYTDFSNCYYREEDFRVCIIPYINKPVKILLMSFIDDATLGRYDFESFCKKNNIEIILD